MHATQLAQRSMDLETTTSTPNSQQDQSTVLTRALIREQTSTIVTLIFEWEFADASKLEHRENPVDRMDYV